MRIVIDLQCLQTSSRYRGIGHYASSLVRKMLEVNRERGRPDEILLLLNNLHEDVIHTIRQDWCELLEPDTLRVFSVLPDCAELVVENQGKVLVNEYLRSEFIERLQPDFVLIMSLFEGVVDDFVCSIPRLRSFAIGVIGYDLIPLISPDEYLGDPATRRWYERRLDSLRQADRIFAISESARQEFETYLSPEPGVTHTISTACDEGYFPLPEAFADHQRLLDLKITKRFLLYSGAADERKNLRALLEAFGQLDGNLRQSLQLVLVGKFSEADRVQLSQQSRKYGLQSGDLVYTGFISQETLNLLYNRCELFVFPSLHEGFGLPVLEAITCGAPVICSNTTSLPEVIGLPEATFDPKDSRQISELISRVLGDDEFRKHLIDHGRMQCQKFSWTTTATVLLDEIARSVRPGAGQQSPAAADAVAERRSSALAELFCSWELDDNIVRRTANCLAANDLALSRKFPARSRHWRIEGPFDSSYSLALLNRETARGLEAVGQQVSLHSTEGPGDFDPSVEYLDDNPDLARMHEDSKNPEVIPEIISRNLYPPRVQDMKGEVRILHHYAWEESGFPVDWVEDFNRHLTGLTCLSEHVRKVLIDNGVTLPMAVSGCGVDHWDRISPEPMHVEGRAFRFLHVSSCFPRKGIDALLDAWGQAFTDADDVSLIIKTFDNPHNDLYAKLAWHRGANPAYPHVEVIMEDLSEGCLRSLYEQCHALVAPSKAEGFGLPLAEAILSGLPVITTGWSGQLDFCNEQTAWLVDYRFELADTHFRLQDSVWAQPDVAHLADTLQQVYRADPATRQERVRAGEQLLRQSFTWEEVALRLTEQVAALCEQRAREDLDRPLKIGWVSTWNQKCGLATYSRHLIEQNAHDEIHVFAPRVDGDVSQDAGESVIRCWNQDDQDDLQELEQALIERDLDAVVIQMNYYFYDYGALQRLITHLKAAGTVVSLTLHSTVDPEPRKALANLRAGFEQLDRVMVHTPADLNRLADAGLADNAVLIPHGIAEHKPDSVQWPFAGKRCIASYGFALPHKGLEQLLEAFAALRQKDPDLVLLLLNAEHSDPTSAAFVESLRERIQALDLQDCVTTEHRFLPDGESLGLLKQADVIAMPYQGTGESSSGAVKMALASGTPVMVTPLPIFDDVAPAVDRFEGTDARAIERGLARALQGTFEQSPEDVKQWKQVHSYRNVSRRLFAMLRSLWINQ